MASDSLSQSIPQTASSGSSDHDLSAPSSISVIPPSQPSSASDFARSSSPSVLSTLGGTSSVTSLRSQSPPHIPTSKTYIPGRCHCGRNSFVAVFPRDQKGPHSDVIPSHVYPGSNESISSQFSLPALIKSSASNANSENPSPSQEATQPIVAGLCHCNTCRHVSGQLALYHVPTLGPPLAMASPTLPPSRHVNSANGARILHGLGGRGNDASGLISALNDVKEDDGLDRALYYEELHDSDPESDDEWERPFDLTGLGEYRSSPKAIRLFCKSCAAHLFFAYTSTPDDTVAKSTVNTRQRWSWWVAGGALERTAGVLKLGYHVYVGDTFDGGIADHLQVVDGVRMPRFREDSKSDEVAIGWREALLKEAQSQSSPSETRRRPRPHSIGISERLPLYCHCGSVRLLVTRPTYQSVMLSAPYPDILCPSDSRLSKRRNPRDLKWWLRLPLNHPVPSSSDPGKNAFHATRYLAGHCMCNTCRLTSGMEVQSWLWIPNCNVLDARTGSPIILEDAVESESTSPPSHTLSQLTHRSDTGSPPRSILSDGTDSPHFTASPASSGRSSPVPPPSDPAEPVEKEDIDELYLPSGRLKVLTQYTPSPGRYRESCSKCGANILLWNTQIPDLLCVAAGLIDENYGTGGARAEAWFDWYTERVGFMEDVFHETGSGSRASSLRTLHSTGDDTKAAPLSSLKATAEGLISGLAQLKKEVDEQNGKATASK